MQTGDYVIITSTNTYLGNDKIKDIARRQLLGRITAMGTTMSWNDRPIRYATVEFPDIAEATRIPLKVNTEIDTIKIANTEEFATFRKNNNSYIEEKLLERNKFLETIVNDANGNMYTRTFKQQKNVLNTEDNNVELGYWNGDKFETYSSQKDIICCDPVKGDRDISIYIPEMWTNYYGYSSKDIQEWLEFLSHCGLEYKASYNGIKDLPANLLNSIKIASSIDDIFIGNKDVKTKVTSCKHNFHNVYMKANSRSMITYMLFVATRYLYNHHYWEIPATAMQIKHELGEEITHWQALLMAHLRRDYYYYYCWTCCKADSCEWKYVDIFTTPGHVIAKLRAGEGMNASFNYNRVSTQKRNEIQALFTENKYKEIFQILKSYNKN